MTACAQRVDEIGDYIRLKLRESGITMSQFEKMTPFSKSLRDDIRLPF